MRGAYGRGGLSGCEVWRWVCAWVTVSCLALPSPVLCLDYTARGCPGGQEDSPPVEVHLTCPPGQVISLGEAVFGRNKFLECNIAHDDCLDNTDAFEACEGRYNCTVHFDRPFSPNCGYATFISVTYSCLPGPVSTPPTIVQPPTSQPTRVTSSVSDVTRQDSPAAGPDTEETDDDNTGLIVGCVVAVVVTVVLLIVAIVLVVRRLACEQADDEEKKSSFLSCMGKRSNGNGPKTSMNEAETGVDDDQNQTQRKRKHRPKRADKNQNMSPRLAPVGQEDEGESSAASQNKPASAATSGACAVGEDGANWGSRSSGRSSIIMDTGSAKRHSSGGKAVYDNVNVASVHGRGGGGIDQPGDLSRAGSGGSGGRRSAQLKPKAGAGYYSHVTSGHPANISPDAMMVGHAIPDPQTRSRVGTTEADYPASVDQSDMGRLRQSARTQPAPGGNVLAGNTAATQVVPPKTRQQQFDAVALPNTETFSPC